MAHRDWSTDDREDARPTGKLPWEGILILAVLGGTLGTSLDMLHVYTRTTVYVAPDIMGIPWWVPLEFSVLGVAIGISRVFLETTLKQESPAVTSSLTALGMVLFVASYALSGLLPLDNQMRTVVLGAIFVACWLLCDRHWIGLLLAAIVAIAGTGAEILLSSQHVFYYLKPNFSLVTTWLPMIYACAAIGVGNFGKSLVLR